MYHPRKQGCGEVYFIKSGEFCKIGATRNLYGRFKSIQVTNPVECVLIHSIKTNNMRRTEKLFKAMFEHADALERGEWFRLTDKDIAYIKAGKYSPAIMRSIGDTDNWTRVPEIIEELLVVR
jgi:K+/H+ antiporter YhaU regulatory subunit KhtT